MNETKTQTIQDQIDAARKFGQGNGEKPKLYKAWSIVTKADGRCGTLYDHRIDWRCSHRLRPIISAEEAFAGEDLSKREQGLAAPPQELVNELLTEEELTALADLMRREHGEPVYAELCSFPVRYDDLLIYGELTGDLNTFRLDLGGKEAKIGVPIAGWTLLFNPDLKGCITVPVTKACFDDSGDDVIATIKIDVPFSEIEVSKGGLTLDLGILTQAYDKDYQKRRRFDLETSPVLVGEIPF